MLAHRMPQQAPVAAVETGVGPANEPAVANSEVATGDFQALHDSPNHIGVGDSVDGAAIVVKGIAFSPGEAAALVDFVGPLTHLETEFTVGQLAMMKGLIERGIEDSEAWDLATGGKYTELAQGNEDHFGDGGFGTTYVACMTQAVKAAQEALAFEEGSEAHEAAMNTARMHGYTAEHYLEDAFSAGHQMEATDIAAKVAAVFSWADAPWMFPLIARDVFARESATISCYAYVRPSTSGITYEPIDSLAEFEVLAVAGATNEGVGGLADGVRKFVHEELGRTGVEVESDAQTVPWVLRGDHDLLQDEVGTRALQEALARSRAAIELVAPGTDPQKIAQDLYDFHAPRPTTAGQALVDDAVARATASPLALAASVTEATCATITDVMNAVVSMSKGAIERVSELPDTEPLQPLPVFPEFPGIEEPVTTDPVQAPVGPWPGGDRVRRDPVETPRERYGPRPDRARRAYPGRP